MRLLLAGFALALMLSGCSWFGGDDEELKPVDLVPFKAEIQLKPAWDTRIGGDARDSVSKLVPALAGGRVFAASADGNIMALSPENGRVIWKVAVEDLYSAEDRKNAFAPKSDVITGGVGVGADIVAVGTFAGEIVALHQSDGSLAWRSRTTSEVLSPPAIDRDLVVAHSIDGKVEAYDTLSGERKWIYSTTIPSLTLRGTTTPVMNDQVVIDAFANGRVVVLDKEKGLAGIDRKVAVSQGKSDLERLVDIDGRMVLDGTDLYVVSYQGNLVCLDLANSGREKWSVETSSVAGLDEGFGNVYVSGFNGELTAYDLASGRVVWKSDLLLRRDLTTPATISSYVAVGDYEGYIHLFAQADGRIVGRRKVYGDPLTSPPVVDGTRLYVMTNAGRLLAFDLR
ncbi:MAG: outer membrane protein assembly factor BamB [Pseudomonadales bacterium]|nr:outer membrane protein assembly factor BamB [Pseudomonadales bacterium]